MELLRLSPATGEVLSKLNLFQGQIIHGRVFRVEPAGQHSSFSSVLSQDGSRRDFILRIAFGSHLIEALTDHEIPEGSKVKLEVSRLDDNSMVLKLLDIDPPDYSRNQPVSNSSRTPVDSALITGKTDPGIHSPKISSNAVQRDSFAESPVYYTDSSSPEILNRVIKSALSEGFINPARFNIQPLNIRNALQSALNNLEKTLNADMKLISQENFHLTDSIKNIILFAKDIARTFSADHPAQGNFQIQPEELIAGIVQNLSKTFVSKGIPVLVDSQEQKQLISLSQTSQTLTTSPPQINPQSSAEAKMRSPVDSPPPASGRGTPQSLASSVQTSLNATSSTISQPVISSSASIPADGLLHTSPSQTTERQVSEVSNPSSVAGSQVNGKAEVNVQKPTPSFAANAPDSLNPAASQPAIFSQTSVPEPAGSPVDGAASKIIPKLEVKHLLKSADSVIEESFIPPAQSNSASGNAKILLAALRTLSLLVEKLAERMPNNPELAGRISAHAGKIRALSDALEGALIAPLMSKSREIPGALPLIFLEFHIQGGNVEFLALRSEEHTDNLPAQIENSDAGNTFTGILSLKTSGLGEIYVRFDYEENGETGAVISGKFRVDDHLIPVLLGDMHNLESALKARGINVRTFNVTGNIRNSDIRKNNRIQSSGLDIKA